MVSAMHVTDTRRGFEGDGVTRSFTVNHPFKSRVHVTVRGMESGYIVEEFASQVVVTFVEPPKSAKMFTIYVSGVK
jgi:hypothetical protein